MSRVNLRKTKKKPKIAVSPVVVSTYVKKRPINFSFLQKGVVLSSKTPYFLFLKKAGVVYSQFTQTLPMYYLNLSHWPQFVSATFFRFCQQQRVFIK